MAEDTTATQKRWERIAVAAFIGVALWLYWGRWSADLSALYMAAKAVSVGAAGAIYDVSPSVYDDSPPASWAALLAEMGESGRVTFPYLYPPLWAHLMAPIAAVVAPLAFFKGALAIHVAALAASPRLGWRAAQTTGIARGTAVALGLGLALVSVAGTTALAQNQAQITVGFLVLAALALWASGHSRTAGGLLALAASLKLAPAFFGLLFLIRGDWRAVGAMVGCGAALLAASLMMGGPEAHGVWLARLDALDAATVLSHVNYAPEMLLYQIDQALRGVADQNLPTPAWVNLVPKIALLATLGAVIARRDLPNGVLALALSLAVALFGPLSWVHYFIVPMMLLPALFLVLPARSAWGWIVAVAVTNSLPLLQALQPLGPLPVIWSTVPAILTYLGLLIRLFTARTCVA